MLKNSKQNEKKTEKIQKKKLINQIKIEKLKTK